MTTLTLLNSKLGNTVGLCPKLPLRSWKLSGVATIAEKSYPNDKKQLPGFLTVEIQRSKHASILILATQVKCKTKVELPPIRIFFHLDSFHSQARSSFHFHTHSLLRIGIEYLAL